MNKLKYLFILLALSPATLLTQETDNDNIVEVIEVKLNDSYTVRLKQIPESEYTARKSESEHLCHKPYKAVSDTVKVQRMLRRRVKLIEVQREDNIYRAVEITFKDGTKRILDWGNNWESFIAYYPEVDIVVFRNEADGEYPIDLNDGSKYEYVGNPRYFAMSPDKQLRIIGYVPGGAAEGYYYFVERWNSRKKKYELLLEPNSDLHNYFSYAEDWFWTDNSKALFRFYYDHARCYEMEIITKENN